MVRLLIALAGLLRGERGEDMVGYALITVVVVVVAAVTATMLTMEAAFGSWASALADCVSGHNPAMCFK